MRSGEPGGCRGDASNNLLFLGGGTKVSSSLSLSRVIQSILSLAVLGPGVGVSVSESSTDKVSTTFGLTGAGAGLVINGV